MAIHDEQINELTEQIQAARDALDLETVAELEAQRDQLINQKNFENSAAGQLAESSLDPVTAPNTAEQELTDEEVNKINSSGGGSSGLNLTPVAALVGAAAIDQAIKRNKAESEADEDETPAADNTQEVGEAQNDSAESQKQASEAPVEVKAPNDKRSNILHNYDSYTYRISLYALSAGDYNSITKDTDNFNPKHLLIQSGGGVGLTGKRHPDFEEDFFFEDLNITTVIGLNMQTRASNALKIDFEIREPIGLSLIDRLRSVCQDIDSCPNYVEQPYLLEIDFIPANGNGPIPNTKKRIPIRILKINISASNRGTSYKCTAMPYNHTAFQASAAKLPIGLNVTAETIKDFFDAEAIETNVLSNLGERIESAVQKASGQKLFGGISGGSSSSLLGKLSSSIAGNFLYETSSYPGAYNGYFKAQAEPEQGDPNYGVQHSVIQFRFDPEFLDSKIVTPETTESRNTPMGNRGAGLAPGVVDKTKQGFAIQAGTDVVEVIDRVMRRSEYVLGQILNRKKLNNGSQEEEDVGRDVLQSKINGDSPEMLKWFKIVPHVELQEFDHLSNSYKKVITYFVQKYSVANAYHPSFKISRINSDNIVRSYQYLFTGKNTDILNFDIDFNALYYVPITGFQRSKQKDNTRRHSRDVSKDEKPFDNARDDEPSDGSRTGDLPVKYVSQGSNQSESNMMNRPDDADQHTVGDLIQSIYTSSAGDMLNLTLTIIGDPALIKQDDTYYTPAAGTFNEFAQGIENVPINPNTGQVVYDNKQVYVQVYFDQFPVDIDDETGITNKRLKLTHGKVNSTFNGIYKILTVENKFSRGEFTQDLRIVRMMNSVAKVETESTKDNQSTGIALIPQGELALPENPNSAGNRSIAQAQAPESPSAGLSAGLSGSGVLGENVAALKDANNEAPT